jgi:hypothetical protein
MTIINSKSFRNVNFEIAAKAFQPFSIRIVPCKLFSVPFTVSIVPCKPFSVRSLFESFHANRSPFQLFRANRSPFQSFRANRSPFHWCSSTLQGLYNTINEVVLLVKSVYIIDAENSFGASFYQAKKKGGGLQPIQGEMPTWGMWSNPNIN